MRDSFVHCTKAASKMDAILGCEAVRSHQPAPSWPGIVVQFKPGLTNPMSPPTRGLWPLKNLQRTQTWFQAWFSLFHRIQPHTSPPHTLLTQFMPLHILELFNCPFPCLGLGATPACVGAPARRTLVDNNVSSLCCAGGLSYKQGAAARRR